MIWPGCTDVITEPPCALSCSSRVLQVHYVSQLRDHLCTKVCITAEKEIETSGLSLTGTGELPYTTVHWRRI